MLFARSSTRSFGSCQASRSRAAVLRCNVSMKPEDLVAAVTAGAMLLAPAPAFASLPDGVRGPQGSNSAAIEANFDALIEQRTGKVAPLPELNEVPKVETKVEKPTPAVPLVAPHGPSSHGAPPPPAAVSPAAVAPAAVEPAAAEPPKPAPVQATAVPAIQQAVNEAPAPAKKGLQQRGAPTAAAATASSNTGLLIGGGVAVLGVVAAAALSGNNQSAEQTPAATAPAAPVVEGTPAAAGGLSATAGTESPAGTTTTSATN